MPRGGFRTLGLCAWRKVSPSWRKKRGVSPGGGAGGRVIYGGGGGALKNRRHKPCKGGKHRFFTSLAGGQIRRSRPPVQNFGPKLGGKKGCSWIISGRESLAATCSRDILNRSDVKKGPPKKLAEVLAANPKYRGSPTVTTGTSRGNSCPWAHG